MSTNENNRKHDRDQELQNKDRDQDNQNENPGNDKPKPDRDSQIRTQGPERLQDNDHRMDKRNNEVQGSVSYDENRRHSNSEANHDTESLWKDIEGDYRKRYPNVTDEDVNYKSGEFDLMTDRIAKRTNRNREDVNNEIREWNNTSQNS